LINRIIPFVGYLCQTKHKGISGDVHLIIQVSWIRGRGRDGARNALALWYAFCRSGTEKYFNDCVAVIRRAVECMSYWIGLSFAISSLPKATNHFFHCPPSNNSPEQVKMLIPHSRWWWRFFSLVFKSPSLFQWRVEIDRI
jgi:hypothetical protein